MKIHLALVATVAALLVLTGCAGSHQAGSPQAGSPQTEATRPADDARAMRDASTPRTGIDASTRDDADEFHVQMLPTEGVRDVMHAKLAHAQALIEGIALEDFTQVRMNATSLRDLSRKAGWRVHTTVAYGVHSDEFRQIVSDMIDHSLDKDLDKVTLDYLQMTQSCVRCHAYMRSKGLYRDVPGAES